jgi:hypothetical protein
MFFKLGDWVQDKFSGIVMQVIAYIDACRVKCQEYGRGIIRIVAISSQDMTNRTYRFGQGAWLAV